jgi:hypothetical protein
MRRLAFLVAALLTAATPRISRPAMQAVEHSFDERFQRFNVDDPIEVLGPARGIYVDKFGVIISAEVNLVVTAITPFRPQISGDQLEKLRQKKLSRMAEVRKMMRDTMVSTATSLKTLGPDEQVVVGLTFFHRPFELVQDLPGQIVMQASKRVLVDYEAGRVKEPAIQEQVY